MIKLITRRDRILKVAERWREQYCEEDLMRWKDKRTKLDKLMSIDLSTASRKQIDKIIGNGSWTEIGCYQCDNDVDKAVEITDIYDNKILLCEICLTICYNLISFK